MKLRDKFKSEPKDFSPWVAAQIGALETLTGIKGLKFIKHEHHTPVGRIDVLMDSNKGKVVIENQFGKIDNSHTNRVMDYASNIKATHTILIAEEIDTVLVKKLKSYNVIVIIAEAQANGVTLTSLNNSKTVFVNNTNTRSLKAEYKQSVSEAFQAALTKVSNEVPKNIFGEYSPSKPLIYRSQFGKLAYNFSKVSKNTKALNLLMAIDSLKLDKKKEAEVFKLADIYLNVTASDKPRLKDNGCYNYSTLIKGVFYTEAYVSGYLTTNFIYSDSIKKEIVTKMFQASITEKENIAHTRKSLLISMQESLLEAKTDAGRKHYEAQIKFYSQSA